MTPQAWLIRLGLVTASNATDGDAQAKMAMLAPMLAEAFPPEAFCRESLEAIARANTFFPSYAALHAGLSSWMEILQVRAMRARALPAPPPAPADPRRGWGDAGAVRRSVALAEANPMFLRLLRAAVAANAPEHLHLIPAPEAPITGDCP